MNFPANEVRKPPAWGIRFVGRIKATRRIYVEGVRVDLEGGRAGGRGAVSFHWCWQESDYVLFPRKKVKLTLSLSLLSLMISASPRCTCTTRCCRHAS